MILLILESGGEKGSTVTVTDPMGTDEDTWVVFVGYRDGSMRFHTR